MNKETFNGWYAISMLAVGFVLFLFRTKSSTLGYAGFGLISVGLAIGLFEVIKHDLKWKRISPSLKKYWNGLE